MVTWPELMLIGLVVGSAVGCEVANATEPPAASVSADSPKSSEKNVDKKVRSALTESELATTMTFAAENHPELARLLEHLRKSRSSEFQRAARDLNQQMQVLDKMKERNPARYANQLQLWKEDSQIRVLVAKWSHSKDKALEQQIRQLLQQRLDTKRSQLESERQRLTEQLQKVDTQLAAFSDSQDAQIDREWEQLAKKTSANRSDAKAKGVEKNSSN